MSKLADLNDDLYKNSIASNRLLHLKAKEVVKKYSNDFTNKVKVRLDDKTVIFFKEGTSQEMIEAKMSKFINAKNSQKIIYFKEEN